MTKIPVDVLDNLKDKSILVLWGPGSEPQVVQQFSQELKTRECHSVIVEHFERLVVCKLLGVVHYVIFFLD